MSLSVKNKGYKNLINLDKMNLRIDLTREISKWLRTSDDELYNLTFSKVSDFYVNGCYKSYKVSDVYGEKFYINIKAKVDDYYLQIKPGFREELNEIDKRFLSSDFEPGYYKRSFGHDGRLFINRTEKFNKRCYLNLRIHIKHVVIDRINGIIFLVMNIDEVNHLFQ
jgi:hypothetical protein